MPSFINENQLDEWVRGNTRLAQGLVVELIWRLVAASSPKPRERRFPLGDSIGQHGPDGFLDTDLSYEPFVPDGTSYWEIGTSVRAAEKATRDYTDLTQATPEKVRKNSSFVFVTPLSGRRDWEHTWKNEAQAKWLSVRRELEEWREVHVIDGTKIIDWLDQFPSIELWLSQHILDINPTQIETIAQRWSLVRSFGEPPPLVPALFTANREEASTKLAEIYSDTLVQLKFETHFPDQAADFVAAYVAQLPEGSREEAEGRSIIVSGMDAWMSMVARREKQVLIADQPLDLAGPQGTKMIQAARRAGHAVLFSAPKGGIPDPSSVRLASARSHHLQEALIAAGYMDERARTLVHKSGGNLSSLLRCIQNLSLLPAWSESSAASELAIAAALGEWSEQSVDDVEILEFVVGKAYGEWIPGLRDASLRPATPLTLWHGQWKFVPRFEGWYTLGPRLFDSHIAKFRDAAIRVFSEVDPKFEMDADKRYAATIYGKKPRYSPQIRSGLANLLAMLGNHSTALTSASKDCVSSAPTQAVRQILSSDNWMVWASLNDSLPLLAEAAPAEFLSIIEKKLRSRASLFNELFSEEGDGFMGASLISGTLWALETLAWESRYLTRVALCLGGLAQRDPGGRFTNRPLNSLTTIFLPWLSQTTANVEERISAIRALSDNFEDIAWKLLLSLLPNSHSTSSGTRRPTWRESIPSEWSDSVPMREYYEQVNEYAALAVELAQGSSTRTVDLINEIDSLPKASFEAFIDFLSSNSMEDFSDDERVLVWNTLLRVSEKHVKFSDADWAMDQGRLNMVNAVAQKLAPGSANLINRRLFDENSWDLMDHDGNYQDQVARLGSRRVQAAKEILDEAGIAGVLDFARTVGAPSSVGQAVAHLANYELDNFILPSLLVSDEQAIEQFSGGYVWSRFRAEGREWAESTISRKWNEPQIAQFLAFLPFEFATWQLANEYLGGNEGLYWRTASAQFFIAEDNPEYGIRKLIENGRPGAAIHGLYVLIRERKSFDSEFAIRALLDLVSVPNHLAGFGAHEATEVIKALQESSDSSVEDVARVEWAYVPLLSRGGGASPKILEDKLASQPDFFCEVLRLVYKGKDEESSLDVSEERKSVATNAYRLLDAWSKVPGTDGVGEFSGEKFESWFQSVRAISNETGHLDVAMSTLGRVLVKAPPGDGLWINETIAKALNQEDSESLRRGYEIALFNSRGAHWVDPTGRPELELAALYLGKADAARLAGYHRLAEVMSNLADTYGDAAKRILEEAQHGD